MKINHKIVKFNTSSNVLIDFSARFRVSSSQSIDSQRFMRVFSARFLFQISHVPEMTWKGLCATSRQVSSGYNDLKRKFLVLAEKWVFWLTFEEQASRRAPSSIASELIMLKIENLSWKYKKKREKQEKKGKLMKKWRWPRNRHLVF